MAQRIDWSKRPANRVLDSSLTTVKHNRTMADLEHTPTDRQKRYYKHLAMKCIEVGIPPCNAICGTRKAYSDAINTMQNRLAEKGFTFAEKAKKRRYRFDKNGNVVEIETGKIVKRRDGEKPNE